MSLLYAIVFVAVLYLGRQILVPVALAILLTFVVIPLVAWIERRVRRRSLAVLLATLLVTGILGSGLLFVGQQVVGLADELPTYRDTIVRKVRSIEAGPGGAMSRVAETLKGIGEEILRRPSRPPDDGVNRETDAPPISPPPVIADPASTPASTNTRPATQLPLEWAIIKSIAQPLASTAIVVLLMVMMLMSRENIRDRIIRLAGLHQIGFTTQTLEETGARIGRYLRAQLLVNTIFAIAVGLGLLILGVPNALLCGLMAGVLRFIPIIGPWLGAAIPATIAVAVFDGWFHLVMVIVLFGVLDIFNNVVLEPWLYGTSTGLSSFGVILAIIFWTWVWGPIGLILAVPMTVCVVVFTKHIPHFSSLSILLGDEPVLSESTRYYQRLLCADEEEAASILAATSADADPIDVVQTVVIDSLAATRGDLKRGLITASQATRIGASARELALEWLADRDLTRAAPAPARTAEGVVCLPVQDSLDEAAAAVLCELLRREGVVATVIPGSLLVSERVAAAQAPGVRLVVVCSIGQPGELQTRRICKALRHSPPQTQVIVLTCSSDATDRPAPTDNATDASARQASTCRQVVALAQSILAVQPANAPAPGPK